MARAVKWAAIGFGILTIFFIIAINRSLAALLELVVPGSLLWTHGVLLVLEGIACFWFWGGLFRRRRHLVFSKALKPEERRRLLQELSRHLQENPYLKDAASSYAATELHRGQDVSAGRAGGADESSFHNPPNFADTAFQTHCIAILRNHADTETRRTAERIFLATALSQNGRLDALIVFVSLCRLVWRISGIYNQRPHPAEIVTLYWAVASSVFLALSFEELDIATEISVGFGEAFHAMAPATMTASVPFIGTALQKFTASAVDGAANCYLALRTGIIARNAYAYVLEGQERQGRAAVYKEAGGILLEMSTRLVEQMTKGLGNALWNMTKAAGGKTANAGRNLTGGAWRTGTGFATSAGKSAASALGTTTSSIGHGIRKVAGGIGRTISSPFRRKGGK